MISWTPYFYTPFTLFPSQFQQLHIESDFTFNQDNPISEKH